MNTTKKLIRNKSKIMKTNINISKWGYLFLALVLFTFASCTTESPAVTEDLYDVLNENDEVLRADP